MCYNGDKILYILPDFLLSLQKVCRKIQFMYMSMRVPTTQLTMAILELKKNQDFLSNKTHLAQ